MTYATPEVVISGIPYEVVEADGVAPTSLADVATASTIVVDGRTGRHTAPGRASGDRGGEVMFYEKAGEPGGKDVRVWRVREAGGRLEAVTT